MNAWWNAEPIVVIVSMLHQPSQRARKSERIAGKTTYCNSLFNSSKKQVRFHPHVVWSSLARTDGSWVPGPLLKWFVENRNRNGSNVAEMPHKGVVAEKVRHFKIVRRKWQKSQNDEWHPKNQWMLRKCKKPSKMQTDQLKWSEISESSKKEVLLLFRRYTHTRPFAHNAFTHKRFNTQRLNRQTFLHTKALDTRRDHDRWFRLFFAIDFCLGCCGVRCRVWKVRRYLPLHLVVGRWVKALSSHGVVAVFLTFCWRSCRAFRKDISTLQNWSSWSFGLPRMTSGLKNTKTWRQWCKYKNGFVFSGGKRPLDYLIETNGKIMTCESLLVCCLTVEV